MTYTIRQSQIRTIKSNDPRFHIIDGMVISPRAGFEIDQQCPREYKLIIAECINNGWLKPVAAATERELIFMGLSND
jgi:hypothetical protein